MALPACPAPAVPSAWPTLNAGTCHVNPPSAGTRSDGTTSTDRSIEATTRRVIGRSTSFSAGGGRTSPFFGLVRFDSGRSDGGGCDAHDRRQVDAVAARELRRRDFVRAEQHHAESDESEQARS